jgi:hypothetical protein
MRIATLVCGPWVTATIRNTLRSLVHLAARKKRFRWVRKKSTVNIRLVTPKARVGIAARSAHYTCSNNLTMNVFIDASR